MCDVRVKEDIRKKFVEMDAEISQMIKLSPSAAQATTEIVKYVSKKIAASARGYMITLYNTLADKTLAEPAFRDIKHANMFYSLNLRDRIVEKYKFDRSEEDLENKLDFKELNRVYASAAVAVGSTALGALLLGIMAGTIEIPVAGIIAGAVAFGLVGGGVSYIAIVPTLDKKRMLEATRYFMENLETEMYRWVDGVIDFYNQEVDDLKKTF